MYCASSFSILCFRHFYHSLIKNEHFVETGRSRIQCLHVKVQKFLHSLPTHSFDTRLQNKLRKSAFKTKLNQEDIIMTQKGLSFEDYMNKEGEFKRKAAIFRDFISKDGAFPPEADRYHLYISLACPWAHRTLIVRKLKGLEHVIGLSVVHYLMLDKGWEFADPSEVPGCIPDTNNGFQLLKELYFQSDANYSGRFTVPVLYDKKTKRIVSNESSEIIRMLNTEFNEFAKNPELDLYPKALRVQIDEVNDRIYDGYNNGVYKAGFATSQAAYEKNAKLVYETMIWLDEILKDKKYLCGDTLTEADIRLFTTTIRHDPVYFGHFKCNLVAVKDLPNLLKWMKRIYDLKGVKETVNMEHIKKHYYMSHKNVNPTGIVPLYNGNFN